MGFREDFREFQEIVKEVVSVRCHNRSFAQHDPNMLLMAEGVLVLLAFERFLRMILKSEAASTDTLGDLLEKATSERLDLIRLPGGQSTVDVTRDVANTLARGDYERAAKNAGLGQKDDYFKSGTYTSEVETLYRVLNRVIKQIDPETGQPVGRSLPGMKEFFESSDFLDLSKPAADERGLEPSGPADRRYMLADHPTLAFSLPHWEETMLSCFHFEMNVRLLAGKFYPAESVTTEIADQGGEAGLLTMLFQRPKLNFTSDEQSFLPKCNRMRNKLIHCEPDAVRRLVQELTPQFRPPNLVQQFRLPHGAGGAAILDILEKGTGSVQVSSTASRQEGFQGWMLQAAGDGTFDLATGIFRFAIGIIQGKTLLDG